MIRDRNCHSPLLGRNPLRLRGATSSGLVILALTLALGMRPALPAAQGDDSPRRTLNFNIGWQFLRADVPGAEQPEFDSRQWQTVSCPHTWNDVDTFDDFGRGGHQGESKLWMGTAWYRKEFTLPAGDQGHKVFIEFEGVRQVAEVYINGHPLGRDSTGFIPFGFDLTPHLKFGQRNVIAVKVDNTVDDQYTGDTPWHHQNWHPPHGGIYRNVILHLTDPLHVTLPLYAHLRTEGIYAWVDQLTKARATVGITAEMENGQSVPVPVEARFALVDHKGRIVARAQESVKLPAGSRQKVAATLEVADPHLWEPAYPYLYQVRVEVVADNTLRDVAETAFGIRNFRFDVATGFWINGRPLKLHGWGHKPTQEWPGLGAAIPDWMRDYTLRLMHEAGGNMIRWGHAAGSPVDIECGDKYGFVTVMPGVDGERDCDGAAWQTRVAAFRDMIIYYRNRPSICVWEGGNYNVSPTHAKELREVVQQWDPKGMRYFGFRMSTPGMLPYIDIELGTVGRPRVLPTLPVLETEYDRTEVPRRLWDRYSPPDFGFMGKGEENNTYRLDSEGFATNAIAEWWTKFGSQADHSGGANWIFTDGTHGTRQVTDVARTSGELDAVRLPKEAYFALQATWREEPSVHLLGHWNYPPSTVKPVYAVARADAAELFVNGRRVGQGQRTWDTLFIWNDIAFEPGEIRVVAYRQGQVVASQTKQTAGAPVALRLTPIVGPDGWRADGADVALIDFEVVDAEGRRCPTDQARVDFQISGPATWRGGYNSGKEKSINHTSLDTECGINRVSLRSTLTPGVVEVTATRPGLRPATLRLESLPVAAAEGISDRLPAVFTQALPPRPTVDGDALASLAQARRQPPPPATLRETDRWFATFHYTGEGAGGVEDERLQSGVLAYSDSALLYLESLPETLAGARLIRTANADRTYWANDYIVATAARDLEVFVAHDPRVSKPTWLKDYRRSGDAVVVNQRKLPLYVIQLAPGDVLRIPGLADQGQPVGSALNLILFCRPTATHATAGS